MLDFIKKQIKAHWDVVPYLFFGVLTTVVNYAVYLPCLNFLGFSAAVSSAATAAACRRRVSSPAPAPR